MTSSHTPAYEIAVALVALFGEDIVWSDTSVQGEVGGLLFPEWAPRAHPDDDRIYTNKAEMPKVPAVLKALPRLIFDVNWRSHGYEQEQAGTLHGPVTVWVHVLAPRDREEYGDTLAAQVTATLLSTRLSSARIIAADLTQTSDALKQRIPAFDDAWEWLIGFQSPNVGVLT